MKSYKIVKYGDQEFAYRIYGNRFARKIEMFKGDNVITGVSVVMDIMPGEYLADSISVARNVLMEATS